MFTYNVHDGLKTPGCGETSLVKGTFLYYHYVCDGFDDRLLVVLLTPIERDYDVMGWGCGYRTLQSMCSWLTHNTDCLKKVPSHKEIQDILVLLEDKPATFAGSREWIGSFEVCLVIDHLYDVPCKILHVDSGSNLRSVAATLQEHFRRFGSPAMMGGDQDASSKGVLGIHIGSDDAVYILIMDPHFVGKKATKEILQDKGWVKWQHLDDFMQSSFYNICLPQIAPIHK